MSTHYNRIAGQSVERLAALSDGVFAVAMTLLVLDLHAPAAEAIHSERDLLHALAPLAPRLLVYLMSFMTLGIFWVGQQVQLNHLARQHARPDLDASDLPGGGDADAVLHRPDGGISRIQRGTAAVLAEHPAARRSAARKLALRHRVGAAEAVALPGNHCGSAATHRDRPGALRGRRAALRVQHLLEPRVHRAGAAQLRA